MAAAYARREISAKAFIVGIVITNHADNETGESYPSIARIAELSGWPVTKAGECSTVSRRIKELVRAGLLEVRHQGRKKPNIYVPAARASDHDGRLDEGAKAEAAEFLQANKIVHTECAISKHSDRSSDRSDSGGDRSDSRGVIVHPSMTDKLIQEITDSERKLCISAEPKKSAASTKQVVSLRSPDKRCGNAGRVGIAMIGSFSESFATETSTSASWARFNGVC